MIAPEPQSIQSTRRQVGVSTPVEGPQQEAAAAEASRGGGSPGRTNPPASQELFFAVMLLSLMSPSLPSPCNMQPTAAVGSRAFSTFFQSTIVGVEGLQSFANATADSTMAVAMLEGLHAFDRHLGETDW